MLQGECYLYRYLIQRYPHLHMPSWHAKGQISVCVCVCSSLCSADVLHYRHCADTPKQTDLGIKGLITTVCVPVTIATLVHQVSTCCVHFICVIRCSRRNVARDGGSESLLLSGMSVLIISGYCKYGPTTCTVLCY